MVTVSAVMDRSLPETATWGEVRMRTRDVVPAGTFTYVGARANTDTRWHSHDLHQLEYAVEGTVQVETAHGRYLLPPQQAAWIPAGLEHRTTIAHAVRTVSVFFDPAMVEVATDAARIVAVTPVVREMIRYGARWPIERTGTDREADVFFEALADLVTGCLEHEAPLRLPVSSDPLIAAILDHTDRHLADVTAAGVCRAAGISDRTLRRRFPDATGMSWQRYLQQARLLRAMTMLAEPGPTVLEVATAVGFGSLSAFSRAFVAVAGETATSYRRRVLG